MIFFFVDRHDPSKLDRLKSQLPKVKLHQSSRMFSASQDLTCLSPPRINKLATKNPVVNSNPNATINGFTLSTVENNGGYCGGKKYQTKIRCELCQLFKLIVVEFWHCGGREIRTPGHLAMTFALQANALDHYATPPLKCHPELDSGSRNKFGMTACAFFPYFFIRLICQSFLNLIYR